MHATEKNLNELLAEAKAIRFAMENKALSYKEAKKRVKLILEKVNEAGKRIAKKYGVKHRKITFENLGTHF